MFLYDFTASYDDNFSRDISEFGNTVEPLSQNGSRSESINFEFLGHKITSPFGIPAGPLLNGKYCSQAFKNGYDVCVYKTVRSRFQKCNSFPNVLFAHPQNPSELKLDEAAKGILADTKMPDSLEEINISNSFGVPSKEPDFWIEDVKKTLKTVKDGQLLILSFQGSGNTEDELLDDIKKTCNLALSTGAKVLEINTSCPNEGKDSLLCYDLEKVTKVLQTAHQTIVDSQQNVSLIVKLGYFTDINQLHKFIDLTHNYVDAYSTINTISTKLVNLSGQNALDKNRPTSGVCGAGIKWAGLDAVTKISQYRQKMNYDFKIVGVGGVMNYSDFCEYRKAGADLVMSATGAMFIEGLAHNVKNSLFNESK